MGPLSSQPVLPFPLSSQPGLPLPPSSSYPRISLPRSHIVLPTPFAQSVAQVLSLLSSYSKTTKTRKSLLAATQSSHSSNQYIRAQTPYPAHFASSNLLFRTDTNTIPFQSPSPIDQNPH